MLVDAFLQINTVLGQKMGTPAFLDKAIQMTHINTVLGTIHKYVKAAADLLLHNPTLKKVSERGALKTCEAAIDSVLQNKAVQEMMTAVSVR